MELFQGFAQLPENFLIVCQLLLHPFHPGVETPHSLLSHVGPKLAGLHHGEQFLEINLVFVVGGYLGHLMGAAIYRSRFAGNKARACRSALSVKSLAPASDSRACLTIWG